MDWFLYDMDLRRERVKVIQTNQINFGESDRLHLRINFTGKQALGAGAIENLRMSALVTVKLQENQKKQRNKKNTILVVMLSLL